MKEYIFDFRVAVRKSPYYIDDYSEFVEDFMWENDLWGRNIYNELMEELKELENNMTQEDKELLLRDLCTRLPYGVKIELTWWVMGEGTYINTTLEPDHIEQLLNDEDGDTEIKPYLRLMSSMTDEERKNFIECAGYEVEESVNGRHYEYYLKDFCGTEDSPCANADAIDWLNAHHFDYRGLIEKGLAIAVTEKINPYEN